jgi:hypothetical protein
LPSCAHGSRCDQGPLAQAQSSQRQEGEARHHRAVSQHALEELCQEEEAPMPFHRFWAAPLALMHDQILVYQVGDGFDPTCSCGAGFGRTCIETPVSQEATSETREAVFDSWQALTYAISGGDWDTKHERPITARFARSRNRREVLPESSALWSGRRDSNPRRPAWKAGTLPTELLPQAGARTRGPLVTCYHTQSASASPPPRASHGADA